MCVRKALGPIHPTSNHMPRRPPGGRRRCRPFASTGDTLLLFLYVFAFFSISDQLNRAVAFEGFSSFTFGSVPGGEPRFSFNGFGPGGLGGIDAGGTVDNEGYYKVLEVSKKADAAAITKAYRKLAKKKHPDKGGDPEEFKMLAEAYEVLSDPGKRRVYDRLGREGVQGAAAAGGMDQRQQADDLFRTFFGRFSQPQTVRMRDVVYEMEVTLEELCEGGAKRVRIWTAGDDPAAAVGGRPGERVAKDIDIDIRRGMRSGTRIVVEGGVEPVEEGIEPGDLVFVLREAKHRVFRRLTEDSPHLTADVTVTLSEALTGFVRPISLLDGRTVHFRPEEGEVISPGAVRKLPGCGMPIGQGVKGDLYLRFAVEFPSAEASSAWGSGERKALEDVLPPKPSFPREKRNRPVQLSKPEPSVQSRFNAGVYDRPRRGQPRSGIGAGNPFGFFGL